MAGTIAVLTSNLNQVHSPCHRAGEHGLQCSCIKVVRGREDGPTCTHTPITTVHCNRPEGQLSDGDVNSAVCCVLVEVERLGDVASSVRLIAPL